MAAKKKTENKPVEMTCKVSDWDQYLFGQGNHYEIYKKLGAHLTEKRRRCRNLFCSMGSTCKIRKINW